MHLYVPGKSLCAPGLDSLQLSFTEKMYAHFSKLKDDNSIEFNKI